MEKFFPIADSLFEEKILSAVRAFAEGKAFLQSRISNSEMLSLATGLSAANASHEMLLRMTKALRNVLTSLNKLAGLSFSELQTTQKRGRRATPLAMISQEFALIVDADLQVASEILFPKLGPGLSEISLEDFFARVDEETLRFFPQKDVEFSLKGLPDGTGGTRLGFLTPGSVRTKSGNNPKEEGRAVADQEKAKEILEQIKNPREGRSFVHPFEGAAKGRLKEILSTPQDNKTGQLPQSSVFTSRLFGNAERELRGMADTFDLKGPKNALDSERFSDARVLNLPNQIKSLFLGSVDPSKVVLPWISDINLPNLNDPDSYELFFLNYMNIARVMAFVGYERNSNESLLIRDPQWETLSEAVISDLAARGARKILCRLERFEDRDLGIGESALPFYEGVFLLDLEDAERFVTIPEREEAPRPDGEPFKVNRGIAPRFPLANVATFPQRDPDALKNQFLLSTMVARDAERGVLNSALLSFTGEI